MYIRKLLPVVVATSLVAAFWLIACSDGGEPFVPESCQFDRNCDTAAGMRCHSGKCVHSSEIPAAKDGGTGGEAKSEAVADAGPTDQGSTKPDKTAVKYPPPPHGVDFGDVIFDITLPDCSGKTHKLSDYYNDGKTKVILVSVHAGWCGPCMNQAKGLEAFYQRLKGKGLMVWNILIEDNNRGGGKVPAAYCHSHVTKYGMTFPLLSDPGSAVMRAVFDRNATPLNMILDARTMKILYKKSGAIEATLNSIVESYL